MGGWGFAVSWGKQIKEQSQCSQTNGFPRSRRRRGSAFGDVGVFGWEISTPCGFLDGRGISTPCCDACGACGACGLLPRNGPAMPAPATEKRHDVPAMPAAYYREMAAIRREQVGAGEHQGDASPPCWCMSTPWKSAAAARRSNIWARPRWSKMRRLRQGSSTKPTPPIPSTFPQRSRATDQTIFFSDCGYEEDQKSPFLVKTEADVRS